MRTWLPEVADDGPLHASLEQLDSQLSRWDRLQHLIGVMPLAAPVDNFYISSIFGKRKDPINGHWAMHSGLDLAGPSNQPVWSTAAGRVTFAGWKAPTAAWSRSTTAWASAPATGISTR